ncbi:hypothetical protein I3760_03G087000 [Carya illinoinensis]|nr:hypothetical protein I3760_03G087000 [Carya illinoinensis]
MQLHHEDTRAQKADQECCCAFRKHTTYATGVRYYKLKLQASLCLADLPTLNSKHRFLISGVTSILFRFEVWVQLKAESIQGRSGANGEKIDHDMQVKAGTGATSQNKQKDTYIGGEIPGLVPVKPFVSVSRMPRKNLHDEHPGFYSDDYSRPRTRPPSHN